MKRKQVIYTHIIAWSVLFFSEIWLDYLGHQYPHDLHFFLKRFIIQACYQSIPISCFYGSYFFVAPQFFVYKRYLLGTLYAVFTLIGIIILRYVLEYYFFIPLLHYDNYRGHPWPVTDYVENVFFYYFPKYFIYGQLYFFAESWYRDKHLKQELEREKSTAELAFLRSQINPHFLFNTINDIYALTYQKSPRAPGALLKLSELLRYMLREGNAEMVPLTQELLYIENVIELQRLGAKGKAYINFEVEGYIGEQEVASLLFIAFVENAFKHGVLNDARNPVRIYLMAASDRVNFSVRNKKNTGQKDQTGGIGLANVRRRLDLIYPGKYQLDVDEIDKYYAVNLILETNLCVSVV